jgi:biopolymer transport protein ExbD
MAMNVGPSQGDDEVLSAINTTPLVDVMLVLLIIFLITIPVVTTSIQLQLPKETVEVRETKPENIIISVDRDGGLLVRRPAAQCAGAGRSAEEGSTAISARGQIRGDAADYVRGQGDLCLSARGITKVAFITEPPARGIERGGRSRAARPGRPGATHGDEHRTGP